MPDNRIVRTLINTKQSSLEYSGKPSINSMVDGQTAIERKPNGQLALYKKKFGKLWKSFMSANGDQYVEKDLIVSGNLTVNKNIYQGYNQIIIFPTDFLCNYDEAYLNDLKNMMLETNLKYAYLADINTLIIKK